MTSTTKYPTDAAWDYFQKHRENIRQCCADFLPAPRMEIPNTRVTIYNRDGSTTESDQMGSMPLPVKHSLADFDKAVQERDSAKLAHIMQDAWIRAPEDRRIYQKPGFTELCNLLDETVEGFVDMNGMEEVEDDC